jgi:hypothetical protein
MQGHGAQRMRIHLTVEKAVEAPGEVLTARISLEGHGVHALLQELTQLRLQLLASVVEAAHHRPLRTLHDLADFFVG